MGGGPIGPRVFFDDFLAFEDFFRCCSAGGMGGIRTSFILRPCPKHCYLQCFGLLVHLAKDVEQHTLSQASMPLASMPKCVFVQHTAQGCGTRKAVTSVHAFGDHSQSTGI